jgi:threonine dehydrogenase-like Zn-dependent dehydrogenase
MVQLGPRRLEMMEVEVPALEAGGALLRVEACGLCGSDIEQFNGTLGYLTPQSFPMIPGHEPVGIIEEIDAGTARDWGVAAGDRVAVVPHLACGDCRHCTNGRGHLCTGLLPVPRSDYGFMPLGYRHGLWGAYGEYMALHPKTVLYTIPAGVPAPVASLYQSLAAGLRWAVQVPQTTPSDTVLVLGCGQRGLASVVALRSAGVRSIIVTGLARDRFKLDHALRLGATATIAVDEEDTVERVMALTGGLGVDVALDVAPSSFQPFLDAIDVTRPGGTIVVAGVKDRDSAMPFNTNRVLYKELSIHGVFTPGAESYERAIDLLIRSVAELAPLHTHSLPLEAAEEGIAMLSGRRAGVQSIGITLEPGLPA